MKLQFKLTMPNIGSWNGKWTGASNNYVIERDVPNKKALELLEKENYHYNWDDGWGANVQVRRITGLSKAERKSDDFCGYDWMVDSIISQGKILNSQGK